MSIVSGIYKITNVQSGQAFDLSEGDNKSIITNPVAGSSSQVWSLVPVERSGWTIASVQSGQAIGFGGAPQEGRVLIVGDSSVAKPWIIEPNGVSLSNFKISLLEDSSYVVETPDGNTNPGTPLQISKANGGDNQLWQFKIQT
ncbi:ricin B lectin domain-containing protein [Lactarius quietus]|nr:ricin B lectin domain-containing protein [Lactarius quietus]